MKKILVIALMLVVSLSLSVSADEVTIDYWNMFGGGDGDYMEELVTAFNESHPDIKVNPTRLDWDEYYTKLVTAVASGTGPDIAASHVTKLSELYEQGLLYSLDKTAAKINLDWANLNNNILKAAMFEGEHYAVPIDAHPIVLYYNKDYFSEAGLLDDSGNIVMTENSADGFIETFNQAVEKSEANYGLSYVSLPSEVDTYRLWWTFYSQMGGGPLIEDGQVTIDKNLAVSAVDYLDRLFGTAVPENLEYMEGINMFRSQESAALITGVWVTGMVGETEGLNLGVTEIPNVFGKKGGWADSHTLILPYNPKSTEAKQEAALIFANWMTENGELWAKAGHIPSNKLVLEKEEYQNLDYRAEYAGAATSAFFDVFGLQTWAIRDNISQNIGLVLTEKATSEEAVDKMTKEIERIISR